MPIGDLAFLIELLERATERLPGITKKRLFGCDGLFVDQAIFALIWKEGRIGLKFPEPAVAAAKLGVPGTKPWAPSGKAMSGWVLVPEALHDDEDTLATWAREAHGLVRTSGASRPKTVAQPAVKATSMSKVKARSRSKALSKGATRAKGAKKR